MSDDPYKHVSKRHTPRVKRVLLLIESSRGYGRACLQGVADYCRLHGQWRVVHVERSLSERLPENIASWRADGVISRTETKEIAQSIRKLNLPTVDLRGAFQLERGVVFDTDSTECGRMAATHFYDLGIRNLAFCGYAGINYSDQRGNAYENRAHALGCQTYTFSTPHDQYDTSAMELMGERDDEGLIQWISKLPHPTGIFACNDVRARQVLAACEATGVLVPEDIAVLGVDNDELICELTSPPLSSIEPDAQRIGREGAECLNRLMSGESPERRLILIPPKRVVSRVSSDMVATNDREVAAALRYIRDEACNGITVEDVAGRIQLSRSSLDRRFKNLVNRSVKAEIERVRINKALLMLQETDLKVSAIADWVAYSSSAKFIEAFKRVVGTTPGQYRTKQFHQE